MWALPTDRKTLLDILGKQMLPHLTAIKELGQLQLSEAGAELILLWASEPLFSSLELPNRKLLPDAIVVRPHQLRDFIAWLTTVADGYRPFTAFVRVLTTESVDNAIESMTPSFGKLDNAVAGLIIAEALTLSGAQRSVSSLSLLSCESTYSYSFARALALGYVHNDKDPIAAPFRLAKRLTRQPIRRLGDELLSAPLKVISGLAADNFRAESHGGIPPFIWEACQELQSEGEVKRSWQLQTTAGLIPQHILSTLQGPREHRVTAFELILRNTSGLDELTASFLAGLLANQIGPGSFEHIDLLWPYLSQYPTALLWYGLCAGLNPDSEIQQIGNCLGRRIVRDLLTEDPILSRPKYDIAVSELEVYLDREEPLAFRTSSQNYIVVELLPGVPTYMKWPMLAEPAVPSLGAMVTNTRKSDLPQQMSLIEPMVAQSDERQTAINDLVRAVDQIKIILKKQAGSLNTQDKVKGNSRRKKH